LLHATAPRVQNEIRLWCSGSQGLQFEAPTRCPAAGRLCCRALTFSPRFGGTVLGGIVACSATQYGEPSTLRYACRRAAGAALPAAAGVGQGSRRRAALQLPCQALPHRCGVHSVTAADMAQPLKLQRTAVVAGCMLKVVGLVLAPSNLSSCVIPWHAAAMQALLAAVAQPAISCGVPSHTQAS
jgi:hypothetical protein